MTSLKLKKHKYTYNKIVSVHPKLVYELITSSTHIILGVITIKKT